MFQQAEQILLNEEVGVIPINWYLGDYAYNAEALGDFHQSAFGLITWEQIVVTK